MKRMMRSAHCPHIQFQSMQVQVIAIPFMDASFVLQVFLSSPFCAIFVPKCAIYVQAHFFIMSCLPLGDCLGNAWQPFRPFQENPPASRQAVPPSKNFPRNAASAPFLAELRQKSGLVPSRTTPLFSSHRQLKNNHPKPLSRRLDSVID